MLPWPTIITVQKDIDIPVYLQIANSIIQEIKKGRIGPGIKLPGTRQMSEVLKLHRKTLVRAYEELDAQGWIEMRPSKGTFTSRELPEINPRRFNTKTEKRNSFPVTTGYPVRINNTIRTPVLPQRNITGFHDGPDVRLMPVNELGRAYKSIISRPVNLKYMSYVEVSGVQKFREILSTYLNDSRGLQTSF
jgi:GntR family transcriptional regulator/MocR family aminotransferase